MNDWNLWSNALTAALEKHWATLRQRRSISKNVLDPSHLKCESTKQQEFDIATFLTYVFRMPRASLTPQPLLPGWNFSSKLAFGGSALKSHPKVARPIVTKSALHLVLRSTKATGSRSFLKRAREVEKLVKNQASKLGVRVNDFANAGNHLHLVVRVPSRRVYSCFVRAVTGLLARKTLGRERGVALAKSSSANTMRGEKASRGTSSTPETKSSPRFWDARPFSRVVAWGRDYAQVKNYLCLNRIEAVGFGRFDARRLLARGNLIEGNSS